eukprot:2354265-Amphidinium_carterae.1
MKPDVANRRHTLRHTETDHFFLGQGPLTRFWRQVVQRAINRQAQYPYCGCKIALGSADLLTAGRDDNCPQDAHVRFLDNQATEQGIS